MVKINIPEGIELFLQERCFGNCTKLSEIKIPNSVSYIGKSAFYKCENLQNVTLSDNLTMIEEKAFYGCESLKKLSIPKSIAHIESLAFALCSNLESVDIPEGADVYIHRLAFLKCEKLKGMFANEIIKNILEEGY